VEAVLGQQLVEVQARHPPRDPRVALADEVAIAVAQVAQGAVDLRAPVVAGADRVELFLGRRADAQARSVGQRDLHGGQVVGGAPGHDRMGAAGVVGDHAAERRVGVRRGVGRERELVAGLERLGQLIAGDARLHAGEPCL
jgi:hypothetical protein